ncbi:unnamed protein product, partial [Ilex paraguariensis]
GAQPGESQPTQEQPDVRSKREIILGMDRRLGDLEDRMGHYEDNQKGILGILRHKYGAEPFLSA